MKEYFKVRNPHYYITSLKTTNISNMNIERLIKAIEVSNLPEGDKHTLTKLLKQNRKEEFIKLILKIIGIGSVFWD